MIFIDSPSTFTNKTAQLIDNPALTAATSRHRGWLPARLESTTSPVLATMMPSGSIVSPKKAIAQQISIKDRSDMSVRPLAGLARAASIMPDPAAVMSQDSNAGR